jgi:hypothetical protein
MRKGKFSCDFQDPADLLVLGILAFVCISGALVVFQRIELAEALVVKRSDLNVDLAKARLDAEHSVISVSGDLSWLSDDYRSLLWLRSEKPHVALSIYCNVAPLAPGVDSLVSNLVAAGVTFKSYPRTISLPVKYLIADPEHFELRKMIVYSKTESRGKWRSRLDDSFRLQFLGKSNSLSGDAMMAFVNMISNMRTDSIRVGISGANNVGKTTLALAVTRTLGTWGSVKLHPDAFRAHGRKKGYDANCALVATLLHCPEAQETFEVFDRTLADDLCFLRLRAGAKRSFYEQVAPMVAQTLRSYDLIVLVEAQAHELDTDTSLVTASERKLVAGFIDDFYRVNGISVTKVSIDSKDFENEVTRLAEMIGGMARAKLASNARQ